MNVSLRKIIESDYLTKIAILIPVVFWVMYAVIASGFVDIHLPVRGRMRHYSSAYAPVFWWTAVVGTSVMVPVMLFRISSVMAHFKRGIAVDGSMTKVEAVGKGYWVYFRYRYQDADYTSVNAVTRSTADYVARRLQRDGGEAEAMVIIDPKKPEKAYVKELFC